MTAISVEAAAPPLTSRAVLAISLPIVLSNVTTPLLGVTNTAVIGQFGEARLIGAVAAGAVIFALLFWAFGFLRMGTTGLCAQADGAGNSGEVAVILARALLIAAAAGALLVVLQWPLGWAVFRFMDMSAGAEAEAQRYFAVRIWSAPFALANYAFLGWFIGLGKARLALMLQIALNGSNIVFNVVLVSGLGLGVAGVALGTVLAEAGAAVLGLTIAARELRRRGASLPWRDATAPTGLARMLSVNSDLMIRTLCLMFVFTFFTAQGARSGDVVLAANAVLMLFLDISAFLLDGCAFATEVLVGQAIGAGNRERFRTAIQLATSWTAGTSALISATFLLLGGVIVDALTTSAEVREMARTYLPWTAAAPLAGAGCFLLDGIFIGATRTRDMRNMMVLSVAVFLAAWATLTSLFGNHGLWAAMIVFFVVRTITLTMRFAALERGSFSAV